MRVGTLFESKNGDGYNIVLDALPLPDKEGRVALIARPPRPRDDAPKQSYGQQGNRLSDQLDDAVPF